MNHFIPNKLPKLLVTSIICANIAMITGCQSTGGLHSNQNQRTDGLANNVENIQLFNIDETQPSSAQQSKDFLLNALNKHLNSDHTAVSQLRYHASPYVNEDDIETNDDSLFKTFLKIRQFQRQKYGYGYDSDYDEYDSSEESVEPYRTEEDYLKDDSISKYLRYDDEVAGTLPYDGYDISKETGLEDEYQDRSDQIYYYTSSYDDCIMDYSIELDALVENNPDIDINDKRLVGLKDSYNECVSSVKEDYQEDIEAAIGYQPLYVEGQESCASTYHQQLASILSPQRTTKEVSYDAYDSIYQTYYVCYRQNRKKSDLEPASYLDYTSEETLNVTLAQVHCAEALKDGHKKLDDTGKTYATDPDSHASLYYNQYNDCDYRSQYADSADFDAEAETASVDPDLNPNDADNEDILLDGTDVSSDNDTSDIDTSGIYDVDDYEPEYESGDEKFKHDLANLDFQSFLADYREMKAQEASEGEMGEDESFSDILYASRFPIGGLGGIRGMGALNMLFGLNQNTPKQIEAQNYYAYHPLVINSVSRYQPNKQMLTSIYSYDFDTPTLKTSIQMPVEFNFKQAKVTLDPAAVMPIMAIISPKTTPTPEQMAGKVVTFELPEGMSKIPVGVFQDSFIKAIQQGLGTLNPEYFTDIDLQHDQFAQQVGATRGIKLYLGSKQSGELIGKILKHLSYDLKNYIDKHPNEFSERSELKQKIDNWLIYNQGFQAKDVGSILQVIEAVAPISFDQFNYFYFDGSGHLIAKQNKTDVSSYLSQTNNSIVSQTRFDRAAFAAAPHAKELNSLFFSNRDNINGNEWKKELDAEQALKDEGRYARYSYDLPNFDDKYKKLYADEDEDYTEDDEVTADDSETNSKEASNDESDNDISDDTNSDVDDNDIDSKESTKTIEIKETSTVTKKTNKSTRKNNAVQATDEISPDQMYLK